MGGEERREERRVGGTQTGGRRSGGKGKAKRRLECKREMHRITRMRGEEIIRIAYVCMHACMFAHIDKCTDMCVNEKGE